MHVRNDTDKLHVFAGGFCGLPADYQTKAARRAANPLFAFDDTMTLYENLLAGAVPDSPPRDICERLVAQDMQKRLELGLLYPHHLHGEKDQRARSRIEHIVASLSPETLCNPECMDPYNAMMLLVRCGLIEEGQRPVYTHDSTQLSLVDGFVWNTAVPAVVLERCRIEGSQLFLRGRFVCPTFLLENMPQLALVVNDKAVPLSLGVSSYRFASSREENTHAWAFEHTLNLDGLNRLELSFVGSCDSRALPQVNIAFALRVCNGVEQDGLIDFGAFVLDTRLRPVVVTRTTPLSRLLHTARKATHTRIVCQADGAWKKQMSALRHGGSAWEGRRLWMYTDYPQSSEYNNAFWQFLHDVEKQDGIERIYISDHVKTCVADYPQLAGRVFDSNSDEFLYASIHADMVLASYLEDFTFSPLSDRGLRQVLGKGAAQRRVYLQHGVMHAHIPWYLSYDRQPFDYIVASTPFELDNLEHTYAWPKDRILSCGMPRMDLLQARDSAYDVSHTGNRNILFAPSWRSGLLEGMPPDYEINDKAMQESAIYKGIVRFVEDMASCSVLQNGWTLVVKLHPHFQRYSHLLRFDYPQVLIETETVNPQDYAVVVTDYSSIVYDFVYTGAHVVYFLPDEDEFRAGVNNYWALDRPLEDGFGPYCTTADQAVSAVQATLAHTLPPEDVARYAKNRAGMFLHTDACNRSRIYTQVLDIAHELTSAQSI